MAEPPRRSTPFRNRSGIPAPDVRPVRWYSPDPRAIMPLEEPAFHVPRSVEKRIRSQKFQLTSDREFEGVIRACAEPTISRGGKEGSWIDDQITALYTALARHGHAHSIEAWLPAEKVQSDSVPNNKTDTQAESSSERSHRILVGGIYGVSIGSAFFAESMFCRPERGGTDASKVCLVTLVRHLRTLGYTLLDVQLANPHTERFGVIEIARDEYLERLRNATDGPDPWKPLPTRPGDQPNTFT